MPLGAIHESTERVLFELDATGDQSVTLTRLDVVEELVHNRAQKLWVKLGFRGLWIDALLKKFIRLKFIVHDL